MYTTHIRVELFILLFYHILCEVPLIVSLLFVEEVLKHQKMRQLWTSHASQSYQQPWMSIFLEIAFRLEVSCLIHHSHIIDVLLKYTLSSHEHSITHTIIHSFHVIVHYKATITRREEKKRIKLVTNSGKITQPSLSNLCMYPHRPFLGI